MRANQRELTRGATTFLLAATFVLLSLTGTARAALVDCTTEPGNPVCFCVTSPGDPRCLGNVTYSVSTTVDLPPDGRLYYSTLAVNSGVTVTFKRNALNTPAFLLASGNVTIAGTVQVNAPAVATANGAANVGIAGDGVLGDDGVPGLGGPGGYSGGSGGRGGSYGGAEGASGGQGKGPGGGGPGTNNLSNAFYAAGGASYGTAGAARQGATAGTVYGQESVQPLVGGSGGGGGGGGSNFSGAGGGGGGGALLIASNGTVSITGAIQAQGARGGTTFRSDQNPGHGGAGGGGSGGAIRVVADTISGAGSLNADGANGGDTTGYTTGADIRGGAGRIRMEAATAFTFTGSTSPTRSFAAPNPIFVPNDPALTIASVGDVPVAPEPTGVDDVVLAQGTTTAIVVVTGRQIPLGSVATVVVKPQNGAQATYTTPALTGTLDNSTASVQVTLPAGPSVIEARSTFTLVLSGGLAALRHDGEEIELAEVTVGTTGTPEVVYVTAAGRRLPESAVGPLDYALLRGAR